MASSGIKKGSLNFHNVPRQSFVDLMEHYADGGAHAAKLTELLHQPLDCEALLRSLQLPDNILATCATPAAEWKQWGARQLEPMAT